MLENELLSIVVPVYKAEPYLDRCVESLVNQSYSRLEIILVDDGSPDRSGEMCDAWAEKDSRIRVIHKKNGGAADARNVGITEAAGEYLTFVDSDDYIDAGMYETMLSSMQRTGSGISCCGMYIVEDGKNIPMHSIGQMTVFTNREAIRELLIGGYIEESPCNKVYKSVLFQNIRFPVGEINEDLVVLPELLDKAGQIVHVGTCLYNYFQNGESVTKSAYTPRKEDYY